MRLSLANPDAPLPALRTDLRISESAPGQDGGERWVIYDPLRHRYFQVGRQTLHLLSLWGTRTTAALKAAYLEKYRAPLDDTVIEMVQKFLTTNHLTQSGKPGALADQRARTRKTLFQWLTRNYLFFRVPLIRPQPFLTATWPLVAPLFTRAATYAIIALGLLGLWMASRQPQAFWSYATSMASFGSLLGLALTLAVTKSLHELGHAYQAHRRGCRVPEMGIAFMVLFPILYTDVSEAWRLKARRDRVMIDAGGVCVELALAAIATLLWVFLPDGPLRMAAFMVATTGWILSLLVNLNPFMRFDGYYLLSDLWGIQNLQPRSFALGRWNLRRALFGVTDPAPEPLPRGLRRRLIAYAYATWIYRFFLLLGIALLVYHLFFKALGVLLFVVELYFFIARPILREAGEWWSRRAQIARAPRFYATLTVLTGLILFCTWPLPKTLKLPALHFVGTQFDVYPKHDAQLTAVTARIGQAVTSGDPLFTFTLPDLAAEKASAQAELTRIATQTRRLTSDAQDRSNAIILATERQLYQERLTALEQTEGQLAVRAEAPGLLADIAPDLRPGLWVSKTTLLARIVNPAQSNITAYIAEEDRVFLGDQRQGTFIPDDPARPKTAVTLAQIAVSRSETLETRELLMSSGGPIATIADAQTDTVPIDNWFRVTATPDTAALQSPTLVRGIIRIKGEPVSLATRAFRQIARVLVREAGL
ncbi:hypothetical protein [Actibacterium sp. 188UL27-1]|uniref:hypothetical protein n=1 Tax=Actibacterium sp. 188UL27-1 TaxID=2786961 RepID=UPI0019561583|nr:hypothetical protein [Actibacterium sp. 188UL27-1]MBM7069288.1 hypothetical protein [Actibacterium sp. 188UL27-1]